MAVSVAEGPRGQHRDRAHFDGAECPPGGEFGTPPEGKMTMCRVRSPMAEGL